VDGYSSVQKSMMSTMPVVICPGFGNDSIDYYEPLGQPREYGLVAALEKRGFQPELISTVPVKRADWLRVAGGLFDLNFYRGSARPTGGGYGWYIQRLQQQVDEAFENSGGTQPVLLIGHSAGGWLARAAMGDGAWCNSSTIRTSDRIACLTTLGAIHRPPSVRPDTCVTRGALQFTDQTYPGTFLASQNIGYVSVGGNAVTGSNIDKQDKEVPSTITVNENYNVDDLYAKRGEGSSARVAFTSYEAVAGKGDLSGDGVVPLEWTQLEGARQIRLEGVVHSINEAGTTLPSSRWYGSDAVIDQWLPTALEEAGIVTENDKNAFNFDNLQKWAQDVFQTSR
jgi:hypothetical protein